MRSSSAKRGVFETIFGLSLLVIMIPAAVAGFLFECARIAFKAGRNTAGDFWS